MSVTELITLLDPINREALDADLKTGKLLGEKGEDKQIYLFSADHESPVLLEIGRLREETFRYSGLGTGKSYDLDDYDLYYDHLVLWDDIEKVLIGSYRLITCAEAVKKAKPLSEPALYTETIYKYSDKFKEKYFDKTVEIGRIFVQKSYWGTRSLDYLWFGMAYYFFEKKDIQYFVCALSIPTNFSTYAKQLMVDFYSRQFPDDEQLAAPLFPYTEFEDTSDFFKGLMQVATNKHRYRFLKKYLSELGLKFPMLYKNTEIFHRDGVKFISFGYDKGFSNAFDGLMFADTTRIRSLTRNRYTS
ncbi:MAG: GNAT family N-acetyltransferase [Methylococcales bacterium]|nr:GNAT family N-acetyltransferase [Methylococcales bacterium]